MADYGALCAGAVVTPIYHTNSPEECAYVLAHSGARLVFCEDPAQAAKIAQVRDRCPALEQVVLFDGAADDALSLRRLRKHARDATVKSVHLRLQATDPDDVATLVYTSGTTGPPKGCMLTHANFLATTRMYVEQLGINETHTMYQFLPLAHVLARVAQAVVIRAGARSCYWSGDATKIIDELGEFSPTHFPAVPRIYEKIHATAMGRAADGSATGARAVPLGARLRRQGRVLRREQASGCRRLTRLQHAARRPSRAVEDPAGVRARASARARRRGPGRAGAARVLRRLRRARARGLRHDRELRGGDAQHPRLRRGSAPSAGRCPAPRSGSPTTARS